MRSEEQAPGTRMYFRRDRCFGAAVVFRRIWGRERDGSIMDKWADEQGMNWKADQLERSLPLPEPYLSFAGTGRQASPFRMPS